MTTRRELIAALLCYAIVIAGIVVFVWPDRTIYPVLTCIKGDQHATQQANH
jgi:hypothetical protein